MGVMTLADFQDDLAGTVTGVGALQRSNIPIKLVNRWINQAMKEFGYAFRFHELENYVLWTTTQGTNIYAIGQGVLAAANNLRYIEEMRKTAPGDVSGNARLGRILPESRSSYLVKIGDTTDANTQGEPLYYHKFANSLYLRPVPDSIVTTIELDFYMSIGNLVNPTDVSPFHEDWDEAIFLGALYRGFRHFGELDRHPNAKNDYLAFVRSRATEFELEEFPEGGISAVTGPNSSDQDLMLQPPAGLGPGPFNDPDQD